MGSKYIRRHQQTPSDVDGVKTRAKTLALQKQKPDSPPAFSYLQLRSRRLRKPPASTNKRPKKGSYRKSPEIKGNYKKVPESKDNYKKLSEIIKGNGEKEEEGCFGENFEQLRERSTRESTPISLIRDPEIIRTPGSSTRPTCSAQAHIRVHNPMLRHIPTAHDMDEFFSGAEVQQQQQFIEKYNFDPANDVPLPGRYEWVKLKPKS